jgi:hypothetical protein
MLGTPIRDRQAERREATRAEIIAAAWAIAEEKGLAGLTLRDVALAVGQAWTEYLAIATAAEATLPRSPRAALKVVAHTFFDFAIASTTRHQLMNERTIPGFVPSPESYAPAVEVLEIAKRDLSRFGMKSAEDFDLYIALVGGLVNAQQANDPGGDRWARLLDVAIDMFADHLGLPGSNRRAR